MYFFLSQLSRRLSIDMDAIGWTGGPARMRDALMKAPQAEGVSVGVWERFALPAMTPRKRVHQLLRLLV